MDFITIAPDSELGVYIIGILVGGVVSGVGYLKGIALALGGFSPCIIDRGNVLVWLYQCHRAVRCGRLNWPNGAIKQRKDHHQDGNDRKNALDRLVRFRCIHEASLDNLIAEWLRG